MTCTLVRKSNEPAGGPPHTNFLPLISGFLGIYLQHQREGLNLIRVSPTMSLTTKDFSPSLVAVILSLVGVFTYVVYGAIWRLYWSPLAHFPGPKIAALTFWNEFYYDVVLGGKYEWKITDYHRRYGESLRFQALSLWC